MDIASAIVYVVNISKGYTDMTKATFTFVNPKCGSRYSVGPYSSWTTISGIEVTNAYVTVDGRNGHGWGGVMKKEEIERAMRGEGY